MIVLRLNDMRRPHVEELTDVAVGESVEALQRWIESQRAPEPYSEPREDWAPGASWNKVFAKGSPLEWFNPPTGDENFARVPTRADLYHQVDVWLADMEQRLSVLPVVPPTPPTPPTPTYILTREAYLRVLETYFTLVGRIYPSIVYNDLVRAREALGDPSLPLPHPPDVTGHV